MNDKSHEIRIIFTASITIPFREAVGFTEAATLAGDAVQELVGVNNIVDAQLVRVKKLELEES